MPCLHAGESRQRACRGSGGNAQRTQRPSGSEGRHANGARLAVSSCRQVAPESVSGVWGQRPTDAAAERKRRPPRERSATCRVFMPASRARERVGGLGATPNGRSGQAEAKAATRTERDLPCLHAGESRERACRGSGGNAQRTQRPSGSEGRHANGARLAVSSCRRVAPESVSGVWGQRPTDAAAERKRRPPRERSATCRVFMPASRARERVGGLGATPPDQNWLRGPATAVTWRPGGRLHERCPVIPIACRSPVAGRQARINFRSSSRSRRWCCARSPTIAESVPKRRDGWLGIVR